MTSQKNIDFVDWGQVKKLLVILMTLNKSKISSYFPDCGQVEQLICYFADFDQVEKINNYFVDFGQVQKV